MGSEAASAETQAPDVVRIRRCLQSLGVQDLHVHAFEVLPSTNDWLRENVLTALQGQSKATAEASTEASADHSEAMQQAQRPKAGTRPHLCIADWQSAGAGRRGQSWQASPGNLMLSILDRSEKPSRALMGLSLVTGIALAECLIQSTGLPVRLKWPNDLMLEDAKLGGLTTELFARPPMEDGLRETSVLTGIGINLLDAPSLSASGYEATSLQAFGVSIQRRDRDELAARLVARVLEAHRQFDVAGWAAFRDRWSAYDWIRGKEVMILSDKTPGYAVADGVNDEGALLVKRAGERIPVYSTDVSVKLRA